MTGSPYINHFVQPDSIIPNPANPQSWNRYSYVGNNPIILIDPTGHFQQADDSSTCVSKNCATAKEIGELFEKGKKEKSKGVTLNNTYSPIIDTMTGALGGMSFDTSNGIYPNNGGLPFIFFSPQQIFDQFAGLYYPADLTPDQIDAYIRNAILVDPGVDQLLLVSSVSKSIPDLRVENEIGFPSQIVTNTYRSQTPVVTDKNGKDYYSWAILSASQTNTNLFQTTLSIHYSTTPSLRSSVVQYTTAFRGPLYVPFDE